jgi:glycosyltransferase involved in cell wall biosynthesis
MEGRRTGVEEYTRNLLDNLFAIDNKNEYIVFINSWKDVRANFSWIEKYSNVKIKKFSFPNKLLNWMFWYINWPKIDQLVGGAEIVFFPNIIFGSVSKKAKVVTTIHDLSFQRYGQYFSLKRRWWHAFINPKKSVQRANKIIAVSQSTKNDLALFYKTKLKKISVIQSGVSDDFCIIDRNDKKLLRVKEKNNLPYKFILFFGTIEPRKNITSLVRAFNLLQKNASGEKSALEKYELVIAGEKGWLNEEILAEIERSPYKEKIKIIYCVPNEDKTYLYNLASLFVYPSFFEGFGFPPLEAARCGVPVICSNNSSLPEVAGESALMIDPDKPDEIFEAMHEILTKPDLKEALIQKGLEKSRQFDWKKTAEKTLEILKYV